MILPLDSDQATLTTAGGKGLNLARLVKAGFTVPDGFIVTTAAYRAFVGANKLGRVIEEQLSNLAGNDFDALQATSSAIRTGFAEGLIPAGIKSQLVDAYSFLVEPNQPVAVRSSATAEDLPDLSFAGQQDTYLHVIGEESFLQAVIDCWSSLWTARAIGYRERNYISHHDIALAVITQSMVPSDVSGVLFTANPLTGKRTEMVIDATLGLGEALVAGQVEPDQYTVDGRDYRIIKKHIGRKSVTIRGQDTGGTVVETSKAADQQALPDATIEQLARSGRDIESLFNGPQDVEWAWADGKLWWLQSRAITSLYPLIDGLDPETRPVKAMFSFGAVQGMLDPMTPFGQDNIRAVFAGAASLFGHNLTVDTQPVIYSAGQRLFGDLSGLIRHPLGRRAIHFFMRFVEPGSANVIGQLLQDPLFQPSKQWFRFGTARSMAKFVAPIMRRYGRAWRHPDDARREFQEETQRMVVDLSQRIQETTSFTDRINLQVEIIMGMFPYLLPRFIPLIGVAMASLNILNRMAVSVGWESSLAITRGLPHNVTTQMDLALWHAAATIKADPPSKTLFRAQDRRKLAQLYRDDKLTPVAQNAVAAFMQRYGMRGVGEIDIGRPRWQENPFQIFQMLNNYVQISDPALAPDAVFRRSQKEAEESLAKLERAVNRGLFGPLRARIVRAAAQRVRTLSGLRETPKFIIIQVMGLLRENMLDSGQQLVDAGILQKADDLFFLHFREIRELADGQPGQWSELIAERRSAIERESHRRQIPRFLMSDGRAYYEADYQQSESAADELQGSPVSPGLVEGKVRVVHDPGSEQLQPGEILVCQGTDPAWTPLFLSAGGLVMEVGGLMTHGSVVAREYGIPAVVGVGQATSRLHDGQRIRVDGNTGKIILLE